MIQGSFLLAYPETKKEAIMQTQVKTGFKRERTIQLSKANYLTKTAILSAIAYILMLFEMPLPFAPVFLKMDFSDIPALIGSFAMGPLAGVLIELVKNLLKVMTITRTFGVGELGNFLVGASFVFTAGIIYRTKKDKKTALIGCLIATLVMTSVAMGFNNFVLIPAFSKVMPIDSIIAMGSAVTDKIHDIPTLVLYGITPFNLFKGVVISAVAMLLYNGVKPLLKV